MVGSPKWFTPQHTTFAQDVRQEMGAPHIFCPLPPLLNLRATPLEQYISLNSFAISLPGTHHQPSELVRNRTAQTPYACKQGAPGPWSCLKSSSDAVLSYVLSGSQYQYLSSSSQPLLSGFEACAPSGRVHRRVFCPFSLAVPDGWTSTADFDGWPPHPPPKRVLASCGSDFRFETSP